MADDQPGRRELPWWAVGGVAALLWLSGVGYGLQVGRDAAVARPESAAEVDRYAQPLLFGGPVAAAGLCVLCVWLAGRRPQRGPEGG